ncbi:hypothetical protein I6E85_11520 [Pseudoalteromonas sp. NZS71]|uniref:hypothetical protein n=1 Tax=unclassified Pseudoalteromonas TaxID=194690 RepID=UPI0003FCC536|nr:MULTISPECIES: hypothetical protein [unclassified Pseudoalteromonas]MBH0061786.1 hypothetical protein [Pseudoalteromonas sp. NZS71]
MFTDEQKLSCAVGELVHSLGNLIVDEDLRFGGLTVADGEILQALGQTLRTKELSDEKQVLQNAGIKPSLHSRAEIVEMAEAILLKDSESTGT